MSRLAESLGSAFVTTVEVAPRRGADASSFEKELYLLAEHRKAIAAVNVVDCPSSMLLMSSLAGSLMVKTAGLEPVYQLTCRDRNMLALQADLLGAAALGIENLLVISGDHPQVPLSEYPEAKAVYDLDSASLLRTVGRLNEGRDLAGQNLKGATGFYVGAAISPGATPLGGEVAKTKRKLDEGARFFQTQAVFDPGEMASFLSDYEDAFGDDIRSRVLAGVVLLADYDMTRFIAGMPGLSMPEQVLTSMQKADDPVEAGVEIAQGIVDELKDLDVGGIHVMPAGDMGILLRMLDSL